MALVLCLKRERGLEGMNEFYLVTTPAAIVNIVLCVIMENKFPDVFKDSDKKGRIKISIDTSDPTQRAMLIISIFLLLFTPIINLVLSFIYGGSIIIQVIKNMKE